MEFCFPWYLRGLKTISKIIARNPSYAFSLNCCILTIRMENILTIFSFTVFYFEDLVWFFWSSLYGSIPLNCEGKVFWFSGFRAALWIIWLEWNIGIFWRDGKAPDDVWDIALSIFHFGELCRLKSIYYYTSILAANWRLSL